MSFIGHLTWAAVNIRITPGWLSNTLLLVDRPKTCEIHPTHEMPINAEKIMLAALVRFIVVKQKCL